MVKIVLDTFLSDLRSLSRKACSILSMAKRKRMVYTWQYCTWLQSADYFFQQKHENGFGIGSKKTWFQLYKLLNYFVTDTNH